MMMNKAQLNWLEDILALYVASGLKISLDEQGTSYILQAEGQDAAIQCPVIDSLWQTGPADFGCSWWQPEDEGYKSPLEGKIPVPALETLPENLIEPNEQDIRLGYDVLGLIYWSLTRAEEVDRTDLDKHGRFPAAASHALQFEYLELPVVDLWCDILRQMTVCLWPSVQLTEHKYHFYLSHDVDQPSRYGFKPLFRLCLSMGKDIIIRRKSLSIAVKGPVARILSSRDLHKADPYAKRLYWLLDQSEKYGLQSAFYFFGGRTHRRDAEYDLQHPAIRKFLKTVHKRGHEIGLHPSYIACEKPDQFLKEAENLKTICAGENISQLRFGGRMHYLRWKTPSTAYLWEKAGMEYDSTLGYADYAGFRCGTCREYPMFDPVACQPIAIVQRPLIAMDCTIIGELYMGLGSGAKSYKKFMKLRENCRSMEGNFTLLWHNSYFEEPGSQDLYLKIIKGEKRNSVV